MSTEKFIYPTGTCFDDALEYIERVAKTNVERARKLKLCHGICVLSEDRRVPVADLFKLVKFRTPELYAHAWVEERKTRDTVLVWDSGILDGVKIAYSVLRRDYYEERRVKEVTRYGLLDIVRENSRSGTYGPWKEKYLALCKDKRSDLGADKNEQIP